MSVTPSVVKSWFPCIAGHSRAGQRPDPAPGCLRCLAQLPPGKKAPIQRGHCGTASPSLLSLSAHCSGSGSHPKQHSGTTVQLVQTAGACAGESSPGKLCLPCSATSDAGSAHSSWGTLPAAPQGLAPCPAPLLWVGSLPSAAPSLLVQKSAGAFVRNTFRTQFPRHDGGSRREVSGVLIGI